MRVGAVCPYGVCGVACSARGAGAGRRTTTRILGRTEVPIPSPNIYIEEATGGGADLKAPSSYSKNTGVFEGTLILLEKTQGLERGRKGAKNTLAADLYAHTTGGGYPLPGKGNLRKT